MENIVVDVSGWAQQIPAIYAMIDDGLHGLLGILILGMTVLWAGAILFRASQGGR